MNRHIAAPGPTRRAKLHDPAQKPKESEAEHVQRLLVALGDLREQAETLNEELTQTMSRLGLPSPKPKG
jgi:hypothetical protein